MATREYVEGLAHVASDPHALYDWIKRIDGDPRPGASVIMAMRVKMFCDLRTRQMFYEPLSGHDRVLRALQLLRRVGEGAWVRSDQQDHLQISFDIFKSAHSVDLGRLELPAAGEQPVGVHSVKVTGWHDGGETLAFANSWGRGWGDHGYGAVPRAYLDRYLRDAWLFRNARYGFTRFDRARLMAARTPREFASVWMQENPRWSRWVRHRGLRRRLYVYETQSVEDDVPVTVIELRSGEGFRLGWAMLFHEPKGKSVLKELFVWPNLRRQGCGTLIEGQAVAIARRWRSTRMDLYLHNADALLANRGAGREFGLRAGYRWRWRQTSLPNLDAIGEKDL